MFTGEEEEAGPDSSEDEEASTSSGGIGGGGSGQAAAVTSVSGGTGSGRSRSTQASGSRLSQVTGPWKKENSNPLVLNYSGVPVPTGNVLSTSSSLIDAFYIFFTVQVWDLLVTETNTYGARIIPGDWVDTYVEEMKAFIGMLIVMGVAKLPSLEMYWSSSDVDLAPSLIRIVMPRDRFWQLLRCFHVNAVDPSLVTRTPNYDRLYKVRKLLDLVFPLFESAYTTHKELSIDEAMIPYKGRLRFKQYMKDKPTKWGIKAFVLSDARNGYVYRVQIYTGKNTVVPDCTGLSSRVVLDLLEGFENAGVQVYMDKFYSSPNLFYTLGKKGIGCCGTVMSNRKHFPKEIVTKATRHNRVKYDYRSIGSLLAIVWIDKRSVWCVVSMVRGLVCVYCVFGAFV